MNIPFANTKLLVTVRPDNSETNRQSLAVPNFALPNSIIVSGGMDARLRARTLSKQEIGRMNS